MKPELPPRLIHLPGDVELTFRWIPAREFRMGSRGEWTEEEPVHVVRIERDFWLGETPVTQAQFRVWTAGEGARAGHQNHFEGPGRESHPAENMDWRAAISYCAWLTEVARKSGELPADWKVCLPTEAEWEYACRARTETEYYTGDGEAALAEAGRYAGNAAGSTHPVKELGANGFGLHDMHGNVLEWCHDVYEGRAYCTRVDGQMYPGYGARLGDWKAGLKAMLESDQTRVLRGGSWFRALTIHLPSEGTAGRLTPVIPQPVYIALKQSRLGFQAPGPIRPSAEAQGVGGRGHRPSNPLRLHE